MDYEQGFVLLKQQLAHTAPDLLTEVDLQESRLWDNLRRDQFGSTETTRAERAAILNELNRLARAHLGQSFNDLCRLQEQTNPSPPPHQPAPNPFRSIGRITDPTAFVGRAALLHELFADLRRGINRALLGETQVGKSSILAMVCAHGPQQLGLPAANIIYLDMQLIRHEDEFFEALCLELGIAHCRGYRLARTLRGQRYILCLDEIEKMRKERFSGDEREELRGLADGADAPLTLLVASRVTLEELFPDAPGKTSPLANICTPLPVPPFTPDEARLFLAHRLRGTGVTFTPAEIDELVYRSGGHPARLQQAAEAVYQWYVGG